MQHLAEILRHSSNCFPENIALDNPGNDQINYLSLSDKTKQLQQQLAQFDIDEGKIVGILQPKSIECVVSILGTLAAGAAYVPVDVHAPLSRNCYIFNDCCADILLIAADKVADFLSIFPNKCVVHPIQGFSMQIVLPQYSKQDKSEKLSLPNDLAYILYTSGSTGKPKGVMITHKNALSFIEWSVEQFELSDKDICTSIAPFHFDLSIFDLFVSLLSGSKLVLINQQVGKNPRLISQIIEEQKISVIYATPTFLKLVLKYGKPERFDHSSLRLILFAGEVFQITPLNKLKSLWNQAQFYNLYGPTETNVVTWYKIPSNISDNQDQPFPIGQSCPFVKCKLWNDRIKEPKPGMKGELIVSGESLASGYLNLPQKTEASFFEIDNERWYKTGDIVEVNNELAFIFIGREDRMVKRNGYRIELAEIESALSLHPNIAENGVVASNNEKGDLIIKAFIQPKKNEIELTTFQLKQYCSDNLLGYMLPDQFVLIDDLPKTSTHKIDYHKLKQS